MRYFLVFMFFCNSAFLLEKNFEELNKTSINSWNENAYYWDQCTKEESEEEYNNNFQTTIVDPSLFKFLPDVKDKKILDIACGNGRLTRFFAYRGADIIGIDSSENFIKIANENTKDDIKSKVKFCVFDITKNCPHLIENKFDHIICNMSFMDISSLENLFFLSYKSLKPSGTLIITQTHPCFEKSVGSIFHELEEKSGGTLHTWGVKVKSYLKPTVITVRALPDFPKEHLFFHRSLSEIMNTAFKEGFVVDGFEERAFPSNKLLIEHNNWHELVDIPVIVAIRFRKL
jgi:SAM-dependent methyltransferase